MHIAYLIDHLGAGGAQRQVVELAAEIAKVEGLQASFLIYRDNPFFRHRLEAAGVHVHLLQKSRTVDLRFPFRIRGWLREHPTDVLHSFLQMPSLWANIAIKLLPRGNCPALICSERSNEICQTLAYALLQRLIFRGADIVTVNAAPVKSEIVQKCGVAAGRVRYIPNAIDLERWDQALGQECPLPLDPDNFHVGVIGRIEWRKNHLLLVRALSRIEPKIRANWRIWFVGSEGWGDDDYRIKVTSEIESRGLSHLVRYYPPQRNIAAIMRGLDLVALPSMVEGFPNVVLEAMASSTPIVATSVGNVPWIVEDGKSGYVVSLQDEEGLAEALIKVYRNSSEERLAMGNRGRAIVEERFQMKTVAEKYLDLYRSLANT